CCCPQVATTGRVALQRTPQISSRSRRFLSSPDNHAPREKHRDRRLCLDLALGVRCRKRIASDQSGTVLRLPTAHKLHEHPCESRSSGLCGPSPPGLDKPP